MKIRVLSQQLFTGAGRVDGGDIQMGSDRYTIGAALESMALIVHGEART